MSKGKGQKGFSQGSKNFLKLGGRPVSSFAAQYLHNHCTAVGMSRNMGQVKISVLLLIIVSLTSELGPSGLYRSLISWRLVPFRKPLKVVHNIVAFLLSSFQNQIARLQSPLSLWRWRGRHCSSGAASRCWSRILRAWSLSRQTNPSTSLNRQVLGKGWRFVFEAKMHYYNLGLCWPVVDGFQWGSEQQSHSWGLCL